MNNIQKICVIVGIGSLVTLLIDIFFISYDPTLEVYPFTYYDYGAKTVRQNWLTIISAFNIVVSITGFFLFKDKS